MPDASNALLEYEADQTPVAMTELSDQGDHKDFRGTSQIWSGASGKLPTIRPNGIFDGGLIIPAASGSNNLIDIPQTRAYIAGVLTIISGVTDQTVARPTVSDYIKYSVQITSAGAYSIVAGTEGSAFSDTRGAAGGPPEVLATSIELGQVWYNSQTAAAVLSDEIYQTIGVHQERWDYPAWKTNYINVANGALGYAGIEFFAALPAIHASGTYKDVYASWYEPVFQEVVDAYDFISPANVASITTTEVYGRVKGARSQSLNPGSFSAHLNDGVSDAILRGQDDNRWFRFYPNRLNAPYKLAQGSMSIADEFPAGGGNIAGAFTIAAEFKSENIYA